MCLEIQAVVRERGILLPSLVGQPQSTANLGIGGRDAIGIHKGASAVIAVVIQGRVSEADGAAMLGNRDVNGMGITVFVLENTLRPFKIQTGPTVFFGFFIRPLILLDRKEIINVRVVGSYDNRLAIQHEPGIGKFSGLIYSFVYSLNRVMGVAVGIKNHLRRVKSLLIQLVQDFHEL